MLTFSKLKSLIKLMRPKHAVKNFLIFLPLFFSAKNLSNTEYVQLVFGFLAFCLVASSIYIINDLKDIDKDRLHPIKKNRPLANGTVTKDEARLFFLISFGVAVLFYTFTQSSYIAGILILIYFILNLTYSLYLKDIPVVDIFILASGFLVRLFYGSCITSIVVSPLLYLVVLSSAFFLGASKRYHEVAKVGETARTVLKKYSINYLQSIMDMFLVLIIVFYTNWCLEATKNRNLFLASVPMAIIILISYTFISDKDDCGDPTDVILKNKYFVLLLLCFVIYLMIIIRL